jgi:hypothetical protein
VVDRWNDTNVQHLLAPRQSSVAGSPGMSTYPAFHENSGWAAFMEFDAATPLEPNGLGGFLKV